MGLFFTFKIIFIELFSVGYYLSFLKNPIVSPTVTWFQRLFTFFFCADNYIEYQWKIATYHFNAWQSCFEMYLAFPCHFAPLLVLILVVISIFFLIFSYSFVPLTHRLSFSQTISAFYFSIILSEDLPIMVTSYYFIQTCSSKSHYSCSLINGHLFVCICAFYMNSGFVSAVLDQRCSECAGEGRGVKIQRSSERKGNSRVHQDILRFMYVCIRVP